MNTFVAIALLVAVLILFVSLATGHLSARSVWGRAPRWFYGLMAALVGVLLVLTTIGLIKGSD